MNERLKETLKKYQKELIGGEYIDAFNKLIRDDGICGTIIARIDSGNYFVVVEDEKKEQIKKRVV